MFAGKTAVDKICKIHSRTFQAVFNKFTESYDPFLSINNGISIHQKHLQYVALEIYKIVVEINHKFICTYFLKNPIPYDLRKGDKVKRCFYFLQDQQNMELIHFCSEAIFF